MMPFVVTVTAVVGGCGWLGAFQRPGPIGHQWVALEIENNSAERVYVWEPRYGVQCQVEPGQAGSIWSTILHSDLNERFHVIVMSPGCDHLSEQDVYVTDRTMMLRVNAEHVVSVDRTDEDQPIIGPLEELPAPWPCHDY